MMCHKKFMEAGEKMLQNPSLFLHSRLDYAGAQIVLFGVPMDFTICFRLGARFGSAHIPTGYTSVLATKLVREMLISLFEPSPPVMAKMV